MTLAEDQTRTTVAIVGGGIAGLTAALQLAMRGYAVTLYEARTILGGNLSSSRIGDRDYDVYPHMFPDWYGNFWSLYENDLGLKRAEDFARRECFKLLGHDRATGYSDLFSPTTLKTIWANLTSGVLPPAQMLLLGFAMLDLASRPFDSASELDRLSVNGYLYAQGYATESVAELNDYTLQLIWSISSDRTSAQSYQDFLKHTLLFPQPTPVAWMLTGSLQEKIISPLAARLTALGCDIRTGAVVRSVTLDGDAPVIGLDGGAIMRPDFAVLAVPPTVLANMVMTGPSGGRLVDRAPDLSTLAHLSAESIPVVNLYLRRKLPDLPKEVVGLVGSPAGLSFIDISQLWTDLGAQTVLVVACSNIDTLPTSDPHERGYLMVKSLHDYLGSFIPGAFWGDPNSDIDWDKTAYLANDDHRIYLNAVGDLAWIPTSGYQSLPRVAFAGDYCKTDVNMATVEAAVQSGVQAAQVVHDRSPRGAPISLHNHAVYSEPALLLAKLAMLPLAYAAKGVSILTDRAPDTADVRLPKSIVAQAAMLPLTYAADWVETASWLAASLRSGPRSGGSPLSGRLSAFGEDAAGLAARAISLAGDLLSDAVSGERGSPGGVAGRLWRAARGGYERPRSGAAPPATADRLYRRHWRIKP